ncbi:MAG: threonine dehydratase [Albidovulum sp.]|nr:threonine dehydratase [Albidovulum sp.]
MEPLTLNDIESAAELVYGFMKPTPQYRWPLLTEAIGAQVWVKHENHSPIGAFKVRGGITLSQWLRREHPEIQGVVSATRGNHGQSIARAAKCFGMQARILVPHGNSVEKNAAMRGFGAELIEFGMDYDEARQEAERMAAKDNLFNVPPFHRELVRGVSTYGLELFREIPDLDTVYVPIGCGSGICGLIAARDALGLDAKIVGVVAKNAPAVKLSFDSGKPIDTNAAKTFADGIAVRVTVPEALAIYSRGADRVVSVSDAEVAAAIRLLYRTTHNLAEGAGAASLAALRKERDSAGHGKVAVILSGGNMDSEWFTKIMSGGVPAPN